MRRGEAGAGGRGGGRLDQEGAYGFVEEEEEEEESLIESIFGRRRRSEERGGGGGAYMRAASVHTFTFTHTLIQFIHSFPYMN